VLFIARYQQRPLHLFGGVGFASFFIGLILCIYLTIEKISGQSIGGRPLLLLAILLVIAGIQLFTFGLLAEMITATRQDLSGARTNAQLVERTIESGEAER
jgi:hypothetical protein